MLIKLIYLLVNNSIIKYQVYMKDTLNLMNVS